MSSAKKKAGSGNTGALVPMVLVRNQAYADVPSSSSIAINNVNNTPQSNGIVIPSVRMDDLYSPRSLDSASLATGVLSHTPNHSAILLGGTAANRSKHPNSVHISKEGKVTFHLPSDEVVTSYPHPGLTDSISLSILNEIHPVHRASGEASVDGSRRRFSYLPRKDLWGSGGDNMQGREDAIRQKLEDEEIAKQLEEIRLAEEKEESERIAALTKLKVINTLFNKNLSADDVPGIMMRAALKRNLSVRKKELLEGGSVGVGEGTSNSASTPAEEGVEQYDVLGEAAVKGSVLDDRSWDDEEGSVHSSLSSIAADAIRDFIPKFRTESPSKAARVDGGDLSSKMSRSVVEEISESINDLASSNARDKLKVLASYIHGHTSRKILGCWNMIDSRFKSSPLYKVGTANTNGINMAIRIPALQPSALAVILCSARAKVAHRELAEMFNKLGIDAEQIFLARRIAALHAIAASSAEYNVDASNRYKEDAQKLAKEEKHLISLQEFIDLVFPQDPEERAQELKTAQGNRAAEVQSMMEEKKKKEDLKLSSEKRRTKLVEDFEKILEQIQLYKGVLTKLRLDQFLAVVGHCEKTIKEYFEDQASKIPSDLIFFIGLDAYPKDIQEKILIRNKRATEATVPSLATPPSSDDKKQFVLNNYFDNDGEPPDSVIRAKLRGPPRVMDTLRKMVSLGKTFPGISYREAVEILQYISTTKIAAFARGFCRRWRFRAARQKWNRIFLHIMEKYYDMWKSTTLHYKHLRVFCWRKLKAWRYYTKRCIERRETFRVCFWPLYTWRKYATRNAVAKEKTRFLVGRVMPTITMMKVFRAWKGYSMQQSRDAKKAIRFCTKLRNVQAVEMLTFWKIWAHKRRHIRRAWLRKGQRMRRSHITDKKRVYFSIWCVYSFFKKYSRGRARTEYLEFKHHFLKGKKAMKKLSLTQRRLLHSSKRQRHAPSASSGKEDPRRKTINNHNNNAAANPSFSSAGSSNRASFANNKTAAAAAAGAGTSGNLIGHEARRASVQQHQRNREVEEDAYHAAKLEALLEDMQAMKGSRFDWKHSASRFRHWFDVDSDGEDRPEDMPDSVQQALHHCRFHHFLRSEEAVQLLVAAGTPASRDAVVAPPTPTSLAASLSLPHCSSLASLLSSPTTATHLTDYVTVRISSCQRGYSVREYWNVFDMAMRFHRYAHVAFANLRQYALIRKAYKKYVYDKKYFFAQMLFYHWKSFVAERRGMSASVKLTERNGGAASGDEYLSCDTLVYQTRFQQSSKLSRLRRLKEEIKLYMGKVGLNDEDSDDEARSLRKMKQLNLIGEDDDSFLAEQRAANIRRVQESKRKQEALLASYIPPDMLALDREDREMEQKICDNMLQFSQDVVVKAHSDVVDVDAEIAAMDTRQDRINAMVGEVLAVESGTTDKAVHLQVSYAAKFKQHAVRILVDVCNKVYREVQHLLVKQESKIYFRALRLPMLIRRSHCMFTRKKLQNYIRICRRLMCIAKRAHFYHNIRTKWICYMQWLRYIEKQKLDPTRDFVRFLKRKLRLHPDFHNQLISRGFKNKAYNDDNDLKQSLFDFRILFSRWKMHAQECVIFHHLHRRVEALFRLKTLRKCFWAIKTDGLHASEFFKVVADQPFLPCMRQLKADLFQITKRFVPIRKASLPNSIKRKNLVKVQQLKTIGKTSQSFKRFFQYFQAMTAQRIGTEQRILFESFEKRGVQVFEDVVFPVSADDPLVPPIMSKLDGKVFLDPRIFSTPSHAASLHPVIHDGRSKTIPSGFRLLKLKVAMQITGSTNNPSSIVSGWQLVWTADGAREVESNPRGQWHAAGVTVQEILIPKDDYVQGLEYMYDGPAIVGIRLKLFHGGFTKWVGYKNSLSTLSVYMGADMIEQEDFEKERVLNRDETKNPAVPYNYVIGLTGLLHNHRVTRLGLVIRKAKVQHVFSYHWVQDMLYMKRMNESDAPHMSPMKSVAMDSIPSELHNVNAQPIAGKEDGPNGEQLFQDSLTMSAGESQIQLDDESSVNTEDQGEEEGDSFAGDGDGDEDDSFAEDEDDDGDDGDDPPATPGDKSGNSQSHQDENGEQEKKKKKSGKNKSKTARKFAKWKKGNIDEPLSSSETQFFDVLRMRMTELSCAKQRVEDFAHRLWSNKELRLHPTLSKLMGLRIVSALTLWLFDALNKRLLKHCPTERRGMELIRTSKRMGVRAKNFENRAQASLVSALMLENTIMPWTGKPLLSPLERQQKKDYMNRIQDLRDQAAKLQEDATQLRLHATENEKNGERLLPRIPLSLSVYNNFKTKVAAARHKESLLERMTLDEIKNGLFGSNMKETLLNKDQMQAIHASLRDRKIELKDTTSLQRLVDDVLAEEEKLLLEDGRLQSTALTKSGSTKKAVSFSMHDKQRSFTLSSAEGSFVDSRHSKSRSLTLSEKSPTKFPPLVSKSASASVLAKAMKRGQNKLLSQSTTALPPAVKPSSAASKDTQPPTSVDTHHDQPAKKGKKDKKKKANEHAISDD